TFRLKSGKSNGRQVYERDAAIRKLQHHVPTISSPSAAEGPYVHTTDQSDSREDPIRENPQDSALAITRQGADGRSAVNTAAREDREDSGTEHLTDGSVEPF